MTSREQTVPSERTPGLIPAWLENLEAFGWRILVIGGLAVVLAWIALVLVAETASIVLSAVIAAAATPLLVSLRARGWSRSRAALATWAAIGAIFAGTLAFIAIAFVPYAAQVLTALRAGVDAIRSGSGGSALPPEVASAIDQAAAIVTAFIQQQVGDLVGRVSLTATIAILSAFLTFFILLDADGGAAWALQGLPERERAAVHERGRDAAFRVGAMVRATAAAAVIRAAGMLVVLLVLGAPLAGPLAAVLLVAGLVPYLGALVAMFAIVLVVLGAQGLGPALLAVAAALAIEVAMVLWRSRRASAATWRVHPAVALLALPIGAFVAGLIGMIVAVPVAAFLQQMTGTALAAFEPNLPTMSSTGLVVPGWLDRLARWSRGLLVGIALLAGLVILTIQLSGPVLALVLAAVLAATLAPGAGAIRRRGAGPTAAALGVTVGLIAGIGVILVLTLVALGKDIGAIVANTSAGAVSVDGSANGSVAWFPDLVAQITSGAADTVVGFVAMPPGLLFVGTLTAFLTFFLLRDGEAAWRWATRMLGGWRRREVDAAGSRAVGVLGGYMIATGVISGFGAATQFAVMTVLDLPLALPLAVLSFFGGFIPYIGSFITTGIAFLVTVAVGSPTDIAVMGIFTIVFNIVQGNFVAPLVYGRAVSIHPAVVLLAIPAGSTIGGVFGMFIVVPLIGVVVATWRTVLLVLGDGPEDVGEARAGEEGAAGEGEGATAHDGRPEVPPVPAAST